MTKASDVLRTLADQIDEEMLRVAEYEEIIRDLANDLGFAEWGCPEHAAQILNGLIEKYHWKTRKFFPLGE